MSRRSEILKARPKRQVKPLPHLPKHRYPKFPPMQSTRPRLGTGERFAQLKGELSRKGVRDPAALAASIGRKKLGAERFNRLSAQGRRR